jgi:hypothetical protein
MATVFDLINQDPTQAKSKDSGKSGLKNFISFIIFSGMWWDFDE